MPQIHHTLRTGFTALCLLLLSSVAQAQDYLIEVVFFEHRNAESRGTQGLYLPRIENAIRLGSEPAIAAGFLTREQNLTLIDNAADIAASGRYRLLRHLAWRQPGLDASNTKAIRVALGNTVPMYIPADTSAYREFIPGSARPDATFQNAVETSVLNGTVSIRLGRFLHIDTRLVFTDPNTRQSFKLNQSRKMRSGELHYIDNPRFGLLTRITPLDDEAATATVE